MKSKERRESIARLLINDSNAIKGSELAKIFNVTRQVIVKDIAILRAEGRNIISTPQGYISNVKNYKEKAIIAVSHDIKNTIDELKIIVKYGGIIEDVIIEHPIYGEIKGILMIKNLNDLSKFELKFKDNKVKPLSDLTNGVHLHTIAAEGKEEISLILKELKEKGFLLSE